LFAEAMPEGTNWNHPALSDESRGARP
jgi:hypothetical protein